MATDVIDLEPVVHADGTVAWGAAGAADGSSAARRADVAMSPAGVLAHTASEPVEPAGPGAGSPTERRSVLPTARMAVELPQDWAEVAKQLRLAEQGQAASEVFMAPGGQLEVSTPGKSGDARSRLPEVRMAAMPGPALADIADIAQLDPTRVEGWTPTTTGLLNGWKFRLRPEPGADEFVFLAFRSPADRGLFRIFVIWPNVDAEFGHDPHMIKTSVGGQNVPVICGPGGRAAASLAEARVFAGKWMAYTYARIVLGVRPGFSE